MPDQQEQNQRWTCADEARVRMNEADMMHAVRDERTAMRPLTEDADRQEYERICHLRQSAIVMAILGDRPYL